MYSLFGTKWLNLQSGPMWKVEGTEQDSDGCKKISDSRLSTTVSSRAICVNFHDHII